MIVKNFVIKGLQTITINKPVRTKKIVISTKTYNTGRNSTFTFVYEKSTIHLSFHNYYQSTILDLPQPVNENLKTINCSSSDVANEFYIDIIG